MLLLRCVSLQGPEAGMSSASTGSRAAPGATSAARWSARTCPAAETCPPGPCRQIRALCLRQSSGALRSTAHMPSLMHTATRSMMLQPAAVYRTVCLCGMSSSHCKYVHLIGEGLTEPGPVAIAHNTSKQGFAGLSAAARLRHAAQEAQGCTQEARQKPSQQRQRIGRRQKGPHRRRAAGRAGCRR